MLSLKLVICSYMELVLWNEYTLTVMQKIGEIYSVTFQNIVIMMQEIY